MFIINENSWYGNLLRLFNGIPIIRHTREYQIIKHIKILGCTVKNEKNDTKINRACNKRTIS